VRRTTARALAAGALQRIETDARTIEDGGVEFVVRRALNRKPRDSAAKKDRGDPFASPEPDLFVADLSPTHFALLNKYNVLDHALLVVTREAIDQDAPLDLADFEALAACTAGAPVLGFYNGGAAAGASQRHKHLQVVRLPLSPKGDLPIEKRVEHLPFRSAFARLAPNPSARELHDRYVALAREARCANGPYNLLVAREWMLVVPRSRASFGGIAVNSLAFAGALFVRDDAELETLRRIGPMAVLQGVSYVVEERAGTLNKDPS
jgi:ATP adenylyltransferase